MSNNEQYPPSAEQPKNAATEPFFIDGEWVSINPDGTINIHEPLVPERVESAPQSNPMFTTPDLTQPQAKFTMQIEGVAPLGHLVNFGPNAITPQVQNIFAPNPQTPQFPKQSANPAQYDDPYVPNEAGRRNDDNTQDDREHEKPVVLAKPKAVKSPVPEDLDAKYKATHILTIEPEAPKVKRVVSRRTLLATGAIVVFLASGPIYQASQAGDGAVEDCAPDGIGATLCFVDRFASELNVTNIMNWSQTEKE